MTQQYKLLTLISTAHFHTRNRTCCYRHKVTFTATLQFLYQSHDVIIRACFNMYIKSVNTNL